MKKLTFILALFLIAIIAQSSYAQKQNDKETLIKASHFLEEKPLDKDAKNIRAWAFAWSADTKEVSVIICGGKITEAIMDKKNKFGGELLAQYTIAMTAFKLSNPDKANDENAAQLAGLESALKTYRAILKEKPKAQTDSLDDLVTKMNNGELAKLVKDVDCGKK
jgi:hypothetical protein